MSAGRIYLDHNATTPVRPAAAEAMMRALATTGNPSSVHAEGRAARALVEAARAQVAVLVGASPKVVTFTGSATEALGLALTPSIEVPGEKRPRGWLLIGATEHAAVREGHRFPGERVKTVPVLAEGTVDLGALAAMIAELDEPFTLALQAANNETGVIHPVRAAADLAHAAGGLVVVDAVQSAARLPTDISALGADLLVLSAHKLGGPMGVGALVGAGVDLHISQALVRGGGQERGLRAGTLNVPAISGFGAAAAEALATRDGESARLKALRDRFEAGLMAIDPATVIFGMKAARLPGTSAFAVPGVGAESALIALDLEGLAASSGAACSSGKVRVSHVLEAMGVPSDLARGMLRISLGWTTSEADIDRALALWSKVRTALGGRPRVAA